MKKEDKFSILIDAVTHCRLCPRLSTRSKILSKNNGNIYSKVMFVAEAPGRRGADRTGIPLCGDVSGNNFQKLLDSIGWGRDDIFITNAVLCNPRDDGGKNDTPQRQELANCSLFLRILIEIVDPECIVTLGQRALDSLKIIAPHTINLGENVRQVIPWCKTRVIPLYHTSPRAMIRRGFYQQLEDFYFLKKEITDKHPRKRVKLQVPYQKALFEDVKPTKFQKLVVLLLKQIHKISKFKLTKLIYLIDYESLKLRKKLITNAFYVKGFDGPIQTNLSPELSKLEGREIKSTFYRRKPYVELGIKPRFEPDFENEELEIIAKVLKKYKDKSDKELKTVTYLTLPMRRLLRLRRATKSTSGNSLFSLEDFNKQ